MISFILIRFYLSLPFLLLFIFFSPFVTLSLFSIPLFVILFNLSLVNGYILYWVFNPNKRFDINWFLCFPTLVDSITVQMSETVPVNPVHCFFEMYRNAIVLNLSPTRAWCCPLQYSKISWAVSVNVWWQSAQGILYTTFFLLICSFLGLPLQIKSDKVCPFLNTISTPNVRQFSLQSIWIFWYIRHAHHIIIFFCLFIHYIIIAVPLLWPVYQHNLVNFFWVIIISNKDVCLEIKFFLKVFWFIT